MTAFDDPKVQGVTIYVSQVKRPLSDRLWKSFFTDLERERDAARTAKQRIASTVPQLVWKEEVFSSMKTALFKSIHVKRIFDPKETC